MKSFWGCILLFYKKIKSNEMNNRCWIVTRRLDQNKGDGQGCERRVKQCVGVERGTIIQFVPLFQANSSILSESLFLIFRFWMVVFDEVWHTVLERSVALLAGLHGNPETRGFRFVVNSLISVYFLLPVQLICMNSRPKDSMHQDVARTGGHNQNSN